jgi:hypothetical protein
MVRPTVSRNRSRRDGGGALLRVLAGLVFGLTVLVIVFWASGTGESLGKYLDGRFLLVANILKLLALAAVSVAFVSLLAAGVLHLSNFRRSVRVQAQKLASRKAHRGVLRRQRESAACWVGRVLLWLTDTSMLVQPFGGEATSVDAGSVSNALGGFLPEIGSPTRIGQPGPIDLRAETAAFGGTTIAQDIGKALSEAPYGAVATALISLAYRVLPRDRLFVTGYVHESAQKGPGLTIALAQGGGRVVDSEIIWSGDFEPAITAAEEATRETAAPALTLALVAAAWVTFSLTERSGQRDIEGAFGTSSWQAFALVRVGLQGAAKRPAPTTQAIYARAVQADAESRLGRDSDGRSSHERGYPAARYNLALAQLRSDRYRFGPLYERARKALRELAAEVSSDEALSFSIAFNEAVALINAHHADCADARELRAARHTLAHAIALLEERLEHEDGLEQRRHEASRGGSRDIDETVAGSPERHVLAQLEAPVLGLWVALDFAAQAGAETASLGRDPTGAVRLRRSELLARLKAGSLTQDQVLRGYLAWRPIDARTHYNLACYWTAREDPDRALEELAIGIEAWTVGGGAASDPALVALNEARPSAFRELLRENGLPLPTRAPAVRATTP